MTNSVGWNEVKADGRPVGLKDDQLIQYKLDHDPLVYGPERASELAWDRPVGEGRITAFRRVGPVAAPIAVGDINGTERGSGARANGGKPPMELIPAGIVADYLKHLQNAPQPSMCDVLGAMKWLGEFQMGRAGKDALHRALACLDHDDKILEEIAAVFDYGRKKYNAWNWARGMAWSIPIGCAMRHLITMGPFAAEVDAESGLPHRGHVGCNLVMLLWFVEYYGEGDDRPRLP